MVHFRLRVIFKSLLKILIQEKGFDETVQLLMRTDIRANEIEEVIGYINEAEKD